LLPLPLLAFDLRHSFGVFFDKVERTVTADGKEGLVGESQEVQPV
jgi:hypothetical protein